MFLCIYDTSMHTQNTESVRTTIVTPRSLKKDVKRKLVDSHEHKSFTNLVNSLLEKWVCGEVS